MPKKPIVLIIAIIFVLIVILFFMFLKPQNERQITDVCLKTECFKVELAITDQEKAQGLMFRTSLPEKSGMLFIYKKESQPGIWMKNTKIPLDIIWINQDKEIVFLAKNAPPGNEKDYAHFSPGIPASYVLEINAGWADKLNLQAGDKLSFNLE